MRNYPPWQGAGLSVSGPIWRSGTLCRATPDTPVALQRRSGCAEFPCAGHILCSRPEFCAPLDGTWAWPAL